MTVCSYYLRGTCKYGDRCRNEHPVASGSFGNQTWTSSNNRVSAAYAIETMTADVTPLKDKPLWPLSSYGPSKYEPVIINGLDESPEELRLKAVTALKTGMTDEYTSYEAQKIAAADQIYANARNNIRQLYEQALKVSTQAESAESASSSSTPGLSTSASSAFRTSSAQSAFGGTTTTAFGNPGFGQPTFGHTGFGSPASGTSAFGKGPQGTSSFGAPSAFGQPNQTTSAFGPTTQTTSVFGQANQPRSAFGQPSAFSGTTQPTVFGQPSIQPVSVFGKPSQPTSVFGQPSQLTLALGQPSQPTSSFAQPGPPTSAFSQSTQPSSSFGQPSQPAFGQSSFIKPASGAFGGTGGGVLSAFTSHPSTFTSAAASPSPSTGATPRQSAFGSLAPVQSAFGIAPSAPKSAFGTTQPTPFGIPSSGNTMSVSALPSPASAVGGSGPFASSPMTVTPSSEKLASGAPDFASAKLVARMKPGADRYLALLPDDYNEMIPADVKVAFTGAKFEWGKVPDWIPPEGVR